ncbi:hypothetical protein BJ322DRAFT_1111655 [Thelephora terrestris]|uniref:Uncharacterized protein n=1 Tax=Thelephora terrestris TaxID=56493 RepID=A0A9P6L4F5_9AGAM|nr:hypothetical protein BJ322DRAFT_1111655 [Thelephora terrestris]
MASFPSAAASFAPMDIRSESRLLTVWLSNREDTFPSATTVIHPVLQDPYETYSSDTPLLPSSVGSSSPQNQPPDALSLTERLIPPGISWIAPQPVNDILGTQRVSEGPTQLTLSNEPVSALREPWFNSFSEGCSTNTQSDTYAARLVSSIQWTNEPTFDLLAEAFRSQYSLAFAGPWVSNTATSRIMVFQKAVENQLVEQMSEVNLLIFQACVRKSALVAFDLSIDFGAPKMLSRACYLGAMFRNGLVCEGDVLYALARLARLAKGVEHFQAFYYLLMEAGTELYSQSCAAREIKQHALVLWDTITEEDELVNSLPSGWYILVNELIGGIESRSHPYQLKDPEEEPWFN